MNKYTFEKDNLQWILVKNGVKKEGSNAGKPSKENIGYYPNLEQAALRMQQHLTRDNSPENPTLDEIVTACQLATKQVVEAVRALKVAQ